MRTIYINDNKYDGHKIHHELEMIINETIEMYEKLTPEEKKQGLKYNSIFVVDED